MENVILYLNKAAEGFWSFSGSMLIQSGILILLLLVIDRLIRKRVRAVFRYCIWMLVFIKLLLPPSLCLPTGVGYWCGLDIWPVDKQVSPETPAAVTGQADTLAADDGLDHLPTASDVPARPVRTQTPVMAADGTAVSPAERSQIQPAPAVAAVPATPAVTLSWQAFVFLGWWVGVLVLSVVLTQRFLFVKSLIAQSQPVQGRVLETLNACRKQVGLTRPIELRLTANMLSPAACGLFNPVILIPASLLEKLTKDKLKTVLLHELAHIKRGDLWVNFLQTTLQIIYFYNPLLWVANAIVRGIREKAVDEMVLTKLGDQADTYSNTLIDIAEIAFSKPHFSLRLVGVVESKKALTDRIKHILSRPFPKSAKIGLVGLAAIFITAAVLLPMAKGEKGANPVPEGGLYENAKGSRNYKIKVGPSKFEVHTVVRYMRDGQPVIKNPDGSEKRVIDMETPDFSAQTKWMDIAQVYLSPEQTKYDVVGLRLFDHATRKFLGYKDYPGIGYRIEDSVVTVYSTGKMLPDSLDIWMRVLHKPNNKEVYLVQPTVDSAADIGGNTLRILDVAKGQYSWANGKRTKHYDGWDDSITSVALKFDKRGNKQYQICAIAKDGHRVVPDFPHFFRPSNGWIQFEVALPMDQIKHFELRPFEGRDRFFFDDVKLPPRSGRLDAVPPIRFTINGQGGTYQNQSNPLYDLSLHVLPNTNITGTESSAQGLGVTYRSKKSAETQTAIAIRLSGFCVNDKTFVAYDKDGNRLDISKGRGGGSVTGANSACYYIETKTPVEKIHTIDVYIDKIDDSIIPSRINPDEKTQNSELRTNNYVATLPNGDAVKLIALFRPNDNPIIFWNPDGSVIEGPKFARYQLEEAKGYELAYVLQRPETKIKDGHENPAPDGNYYSIHGWKPFQLESNEPLVIKRASGYGPWVDMGTIKEGQDLDNYILTEVSEVAKGPLKQVQAKMFWKFNPDFGIRLIAVDKKGKEYPMEASDTFLGNFRKGQQMLYFQAAMGLNKNDLSHFKIQKRPLYWVQFKDFALEPTDNSTNSERQTQNYTATLPNGVTVDIPLPKLTAHRYYKAGELIKIEMKQSVGNWKPTLEDIYRDIDTNDGNPMYVMVNGKEYQSNAGIGPFGGGTHWLTPSDMTYEDVDFPPGKYTFAYGWKNLDVIDPDKPDERVHFDRLMTNEVEFEVVDEVPADYFKEVYEDGWDEILDANIEPWFTDNPGGVAGTLIGLKVQALPFDIAFDVYAQSEDMDQPELVAQQLARKANSGGNYLFWIKPPSLTWGNVGDKRWRIILKPSQQVAAEHPPIRNYYGREYTTDWLTFKKSKWFEKNREMFKKREKEKTTNSESKTHVFDFSNKASLNLHGQVVFQDMQPAYVPSSLVGPQEKTYIMKPNPHVEAGTGWDHYVQADSKGYFSIELSKAEYESIKAQNSMLSVIVPNKTAYTEPFQFDIHSLSLDKDSPALIKLPFNNPFGETNNYTATLPNGVTVELLGVCKELKKNATWWRPDGTQMPSPATDASYWRTPPMSGIETMYTFLAKATGGEDISTQMKIYEGFGSSTRTGKDGTVLCHVKHPDRSKTYHKDAFVKGPVEIGIAQGPWLKARGQMSSSDLSKIPRSFLVGSHDQIVIQPPHREKSSPQLSTTFWSTTSSHDYEYRLVFKLKDGSTCEQMRALMKNIYTIETGGLKNSDLKTMAFNVDKPIDQIVDYELLYRKFQYVRFDEVAFKPDIKTDVRATVISDNDIALLPIKTDAKIAEKPSTNSEQPTTNYTATLPNGVTVELLGVCEHPSEGKQWWKPDGSPFTLPEGLVIKESSRMITEEKLHKYVFLFNYQFEDEMSSSYRIEGSTGIATMSTEIPSGGTGGYEAEMVHFKEPPDSTTVHVSVATGPWQTKFAGFGKGDFVLPDLLISAPIEENGNLFITTKEHGYNYKYSNHQPRVILKSHKGDIITTNYISLTHPDADELQLKSEFKNIKLDEVQEISYQTRSYFPVTFKNVALRPGGKTQSSVEKAEMQEGKLEFRIVADIATEQAQNISFPQSDLDGYIWVATKNEENKGQQWPWYTDLPYKKVDDAIYLLVNNKPSGTMLADGSWGLQKVYPRTDAMGRIAVGFDFDERGAEAFYILTSNHIKKRLAIIVDDVIYSAPQVNSAVRGSGIITGHFDEAEVITLVDILSRGTPSVVPLAEDQQPGFGPTVEITINDAVSVKSDSAIDFDTGKLFSLPDNWIERTPEEMMQWLTETGLDASGASRDTVKGLMCEDMVFASMNNSYWDNVKPDLLATNNLWEVGKPGRPAYMTGKGELPVTYIFKTREGGIGVLQITGFNENPNGIKIRYKMVQNYKNVFLRPGGEREGKIEQAAGSSQKAKELTTKNTKDTESNKLKIIKLAIVDENSLDELDSVKVSLFDFSDEKVIDFTVDLKGLTEREIGGRYFNKTLAAKADLTIVNDGQIVVFGPSTAKFQGMSLEEISKIEAEDLASHIRAEDKRRPREFLEFPFWNQWLRPGEVGAFLTEDGVVVAMQAGEFTAETMQGEFKYIIVGHVDPQNLPEPKLLGQNK